MNQKNSAYVLRKGNTPLIGVIILIVALTAGAIGYLAVQKGTTPKPVSTVPKTTEPATELATDGWQTYRNEQYGFEIKYPQDWSEGKEVSNNGSWKKIFNSPETVKIKSESSFREDGGEYADDVVVGYYPDLKSYLLATTPEINYDSLQKYIESSKAFSDAREISLSGEKAWIGEQSYFGENYQNVIVEKKGHIYTLLSTKSKFKELFSQAIILKFKFIDQLNILGWQTYRNEKYGFELGYPAGVVPNEENSNTVIFDFPKYSGYFSVSVNDNLGKASVIKYVDDQLKEGEGYPYKRTSFSVLGINSIKLGRYDLGIIEEVYIPKGEKIYLLRFEFSFDPSNATKNSEGRSLIDQILYTFKFTK